MMNKIFPVLALAGALVGFVPATASAMDRDDHHFSQRQEYREQDRHEQREARERFQRRYRDAGDRDRDHDRDRYVRYSNGYYDRYGYWHVYRG